jgi:hypothetical protein
MLSIQQEELHPVRIGPVAHQPAADEATVTYAGLAALLPATLQSLCSCAGLFFARIVSRSSDGVEESVAVEVAALERYFDADDDTYDLHVRSLTLPQRVFARLQEWDRRLAGMPTSDVRGQLAGHDLSVGGLTFRLAPLLLMQVLLSLCTTTLSEQQQQAEKQQLQPQMDVLEIEPEPETIIIPLRAIQKALTADPTYQALGKHYRPSRRGSLPRMLVRSALAWIKEQREEIKY